MKVDFDNYNNIDIDENQKSLLYALLIDTEELNQLLEDKDEAYKKVYMDFQSYHDEYSPERTDPCPDYYGYFTLRFEKNPYEIVGGYMDINDLDDVLCALIDLIKFKFS